MTLYFLLGLGWFVFYGLLGTLQPGSFAEAGVTLVGRIAPSKLPYFSLVSLTTAGYGDIVAANPIVRIVSALQGSARVLYIAIPIAAWFPLKLLVRNDPTK